MSGINDTAYPQLRTEISDQDLISVFTPSATERRFIAHAYRRATTQALIAVQLKLLQRLGYFIALDNVPNPIVKHICGCYRIQPFSMATLQRYDQSGSKSLHQRLLREFVGLRLLNTDAQDWLEGEAVKAAQTKQELPDIINILLEELVHHRYPFMLQPYRARRSLLFQCLDAMALKSSSPDDSLLRAVSWIAQFRSSHKEYVPADSGAIPLDLTWLVDRKWHTLIQGQGEEAAPGLVHRKYLELCILSHVMDELKSGDLYVQNSDQYDDYRDHLVSWEEFDAEIGQYSDMVGLPADADDFVVQHKQQLASLARHVDARFPDNEHVAMIESGLLLRRSERAPPPEGLPEVDQAISDSMATAKHRFIDKVHVRYVEKEKRHWASLENFNSQRIAIGEKFYRDNDRLLEGGIWAEVTLVHNDIDEDDYAFSIEDLRPIQLTRFDFARYTEGRAAFTRDEWLAAVLRSVGLEPTKLSHRVKMHFIARLAALVEPNYNYIELGPRGTGKSYFFSEFSPYATLISGGQATKATLFYNNARRKVGLVGYWDTVAFDEVGGIKVRDPDTIQIMKDFMANGRFSRGAEVIADASLSFVGNIDVSVQQVVNSNEHDLFQPLPPELDLAVMDRFAAYIPGWEMPKNSSEFLTSNYGFITDYLAEAFHYQFKHTNRYEEVSKRIRLGKAIEGRDEKGIKKTVCAFLKILHPNGPPTDAEFEEYVAYATECRRRVKEQMNKRKPDDEFARIGLSYFKAGGEEVVVFCPESKDAIATQEPARRKLRQSEGQPIEPAEPTPVQQPAPVAKAAHAEPPAPQAPAPVNPVAAATPSAGPKEQHFSILYGDTGYSYESIMGPYLQGAKAVVIEDPYIRLQHQIQNFVRFCETVLKAGTVKKISLITGHDDKTPLAEMAEKLEELKQSLLELDVELEVKLNPNIHDREIRLDNGWIIKIGRGLDFYQKPSGWFEVGAHDLNLRKCLETKVDIFRAE